MAYSAKAIANFFIKKAHVERTADLTLMKLLKLIYFAHGWHLALYRKPLIRESIVAWKFGPVIENLYHEYKYFGLSPITFVDVSEEANPPLDMQTLRLLNRIWEVYQPYTGIQLSNWTHMEDSPWHKVWYEERGQYRMNHPIPNQLIQNYFNQLAQERETHGRCAATDQDS